jgi:hypothetical protein
MLRSFTVIDPNLMNLIREDPRYTKMSSKEILVKFVSGRMMVKEVRYVDDVASGPCQRENFSRVAECTCLIL